MKKRILLVGLDLEPFPDGLKRLLGPDDSWEFTLISSGREAFDALAGLVAKTFDGLMEPPFDAAIVDIALSDVDGTRVLEEIRLNYPQTLRFVYAPVSADSAQMKSWSTVHHFLAKPCSERILFDVLKRAFTFAQWLPNRALHGLITNLQMIPSPPSLYLDVARELESPVGTASSVGELISRDPAMTAKVLQIANSAAFGLQQQVGDAATAVMYLGVETVKSLILLAHTFAYFESFKPSQFSLQVLWNHLLTTAHYSRLIGLEEGWGGERGARVFTAGMLHDLGKLVLAVNLSEQFGLALKVARENRIPLWKIERDLIGASHGEIGAALLGIWGLPTEIVEAVAWHHEPRRVPSLTICPLTIVHVANIMAHRGRQSDLDLVASDVDETYLADLNLADRLPVWEAACLGG